MKTQQAPTRCAASTSFTLPLKRLDWTAFSVLLGGTFSWGQGLDTESLTLPPAGEYVSPGQFHE